jgi:hypothetical protein
MSHAGHAAGTEETRYAFRILLRQINEKRQVRDLNIYGMIILK